MRNHPSRGVLVVVALAALAIAGALAQRADAKTSVIPPKTFAANLVPSFTVRGATVVEALSVTNTSSQSSGYRLGSVDFAIPSGFKVVATNWSFGQWGWNASVSGGAVHLRASNATSTLKPGQTVVFLIWVVVPCLSPNSTTWTATSADGFTTSSTPTLRSFGNCSFAFHVSNPQHVGAPISTTVRTVDGFGWPTSAFDGTATVTGTLGDGPSGKTPDYNAALSFAKGVASGQDLATPYAIEQLRQLTVTSGPIDGSSNRFDVDGGAVDHLAFIQQPTDVDAGAVIAPAVTVGEYDAGGNLESVSDPITLSIGNDAAGGSTLGGTPLQTSAGGVATFNDLTLDQAGTGFTLKATSGSLTATSDPFDVAAVEASGCDGTKCVYTDPASHTSLWAADGALDSVTFGPPNEPYSCGTDGPSIGSIVNYIPHQDSGPTQFQMTFRYDPDEVQTYINQHDHDPSLCMQKNSDSPFVGVPQCPIEGVQTPCVVSQGFEYAPITTALIPIDYQFTVFVSSDDPRVAAGN